MFTRGPWQYSQSKVEKHHEIWAGDTHFIGEPSCEDVSYEEAGANAKLMAAAPELLTMCREALDAIRVLSVACYEGDLGKKLKAVIAKAVPGA